MPRDYTGADFILRGLPSTRERQEAVESYNAQQERQRGQARQEIQYQQRQQEAQERIHQLEIRTYETLMQELRGIYSFSWGLWGFVEQIPKEELEIKDPVLRRVASLQRRFKRKTLRKTNVKPIPLP